jgi:ADP-heptose:LPS heptosyltransferase
VALSLFRAVERAVSPRQPPLDSIRNFLILQYARPLGSVIHATPLIAALCAALPDARIIAAASGLGREVLENDPRIQRMISTENPMSHLREAVGSLRTARPFDGAPYATLQTSGNERTLVSVAAALSGAHTRVGFSVHPLLATEALSFDPTLSQIANNLCILAALGHGEALAAALAADANLAEPQLFLTPQHVTTAHSLLREQGIDESRPIAIFVTQTFVAQRKSWRDERFRAVAIALNREYEMQPVFVGTSADVSAIDALREGLCFTTANLAGRTSLLELAAIMSLCDVAVTLDTGPMHVARAVRLPLVVIAPAWSPAHEWLPVGNPRARILKNADMPTATPYYIIDEVSTEEVEQSLRELLALYPPRGFIGREVPVNESPIPPTR